MKGRSNDGRAFLYVCLFLFFHLITFTLLIFGLFSLLAPFPHCYIELPEVLIEMGLLVFLALREEEANPLAPDEVRKWYDNSPLPLRVYTTPSRDDSICGFVSYCPGVFFFTVLIADFLYGH
jgi:hypothetical protein